MKLREDNGLLQNVVNTVLRSFMVAMHSCMFSQLEQEHVFLLAFYVGFRHGSFQFAVIPHVEAATLGVRYCPVVRFVRCLRTAIKECVWSRSCSSRATRCKCNFYVFDMSHSFQMCFSIVPPGTPFLVYSVENSVVIGHHFYSLLTLAASRRALLWEHGSTRIKSLVPSSSAVFFLKALQLFVAPNAPYPFLNLTNTSIGQRTGITIY